MSKFRLKVRSSSWSRTPPSARLAVGAIIIAVVGSLGLTPKSIFGWPLPWPYAAMWGAVGWGASGLSYRPMIVLTLFGFAQDIAFEAPLGCFMLVNLTAYGLSAAAAAAWDVRGDVGAQAVTPAAVIGAGFAVLWLLASGVADYPVTVAPLAVAYLATLGLYYPFEQLFLLGGRPGEPAGAPA